MKVLITTTTFAKANKRPLEILKKNNLSFILNPYGRRLSEEEIKDLLRENPCPGLIAGTEPLTERVLEEAAGSLRVISRVGAGLDNVDLDAAKRLNIKIFNTPDVLTDSVAELTIGLIIDCLRGISAMDRKMRKKIWQKETGSLLKGKTMGIIGFGRIGKRVAEIAKTFGVEIVYYDIRNIEKRPFKGVVLEVLLKISDIISIHTSSKEKIITKEAISNMKKDAVLVNTSRGTVIDQEALYDALRMRKIASAALDVYDNEPYRGRLTKLDNVILTPHIGSYAKEARIDMEIKSVENLINGLKREKIL